VIIDDYPEITKDISNVKYLILRNPAWGLVHTETNGDECFSRVHISSGSSLFCAIFTKIQKFFTIIGSLALLGLLFMAARKFYLFTLAVKEKRRRQIGLIVDEIFSLLVEKTKEDTENAYLSVHLMKEKILLDENMNISVWNEAISILEKNEKRLVFGYENINGEDVKVIRLLDPIDSCSVQQKNSPPRSSVGNLKKWIGPAFDKSNKITPPTNCLKIRNMFEKYEVTNENLQTCIQDTILLKVGEKGCKILDVQLDRKTCCVYVKCLTCADAGIVHNEINGWWLDQRLVVVKFLKEEKYDQRFPNANKSGIIGLSSSANLSQTKLYYNSNEEHDSDSEF
jgi:membrane protein Man1